LIERKLENLLLEKFKEEEFADCYVVEIQQNNTKVNVFIDSDSNMNFVKCRKISRYLEEHIDENKWLGEKYVLNVSSPGVDRPLKFVRQYKKNIGRKVEVTPKGEKPIKGTLVEVDEEGILIEEKKRVKEGKKKVNKIIQTKFAFDDIKKTVVKISF